MENKKKLYEVVLKNKDSEGIFAYSLVSDPAVELPFIKLSKEEKRIEVKLAGDKKKQNLMGILLVPDKEIPRAGGYDIVFRRDVIEQLAILAAQKGSLQNITVEHGDTKIKGITTYQQWIVESDNDKVYEHFSKEEAPHGSYAVCAHVHDAADFDRIDKSNLMGFSIEALLNFAQMELSTQKEEPKIDTDEVIAEAKCMMVDEVLESGLPVDLQWELVGKILKQGDK